MNVSFGELGVRHAACALSVTGSNRNARETAAAGAAPATVRPGSAVAVATCWASARAARLLGDERLTAGSVQCLPRFSGPGTVPRTHVTAQKPGRSGDQEGAGQKLPCTQDTPAGCFRLTVLRGRGHGHTGRPSWKGPEPPCSVAYPSSYREGPGPRTGLGPRGVSGAMTRCQIPVSACCSFYNRVFSQIEKQKRDERRHATCPTQSTSRSQGTHTPWLKHT